MAEPAEVRAAGAVLWRHDRGRAEVLLVHRPSRDDWSLPKGKRVPGEHILATAARETFEETGVRPVLGRRLRAVRYRAGGAPKRVDYWAARAAVQARPDGPAGAEPRVPPAEVDRAEWLTLPEARARLSYPHDGGVLDDLEAWPGETAPLLLLRHARALGKKKWHADDTLRPLDGRGKAEAELLAGLLACFAPRRVISSPATRCVDTVAPYAARAGATVESDPAFGLAGPSLYRTDGDDAGHARDAREGVTRDGVTRDGGPGERRAGSGALVGVGGSGCGGAGHGGTAGGTGYGGPGYGGTVRGAGDGDTVSGAGDGGTVRGAGHGGAGYGGAGPVGTGGGDTAGGGLVPAGAAARTVTDLLAGGVPAVICAHGENLPGLLAAACARLGVAPPGDPELPKGGFWVLHAGGGALASMERYDLSGLPEE